MLLQAVCCVLMSLDMCLCTDEWTCVLLQAVCCVLMGLDMCLCTDESGHVCCYRRCAVY